MKSIFLLRTAFAASALAALPTADARSAEPLKLESRDFRVSGDGYHRDGNGWLAIDPEKNQEATVTAAFPFPSGKYHVTIRVIAGKGEIYLVYLPEGGACELDLKGVAGEFTVRWFDPRNGGALAAGPAGEIVGGGKRPLGVMPGAPEMDWLAVIVRKYAGADRRREFQVAERIGGG